MPSAPPARVSVIIPTKDRSGLLRHSLATVRGLEGTDVQLQVIVADNGSTDDTEDVARSFGAEVVRTLTPGPAAARNAALRVARGEFLAFLDDDDLWTRSHLRPQIALLRKHPNLAGVMGQIVLTDVDRNPLGDPYPDQLSADGHVLRDFLDHWPQIGALVTRSAVRETVGYFDERLGAAEDWDWHLRLAARHQIGFVPVPSVLFRMRPAEWANEDDPTYLRSRCNRRVFWMNVRRTGLMWRHPWFVGRTELRYNGTYAGYLLNHAMAHCEHNRPRLARRCVQQAIRISPLHVAWLAVCRPEVRSALRVALLNRCELVGS